MATVAPPGQRVVLRDVSWETYQRLLADLEDRRAPRLTFDQGVLEIMSPLPEHERINRMLALLVEIYAEAKNIDIENLGSTTFRRDDLERGFEPDSCFYIRNVGRIRGKDRLDLRVDPPPDLVIEIDLTRDSLRKLEIYAQFGVPEVWRYDGERLRIMTLAISDYTERSSSEALPGLGTTVLSTFLREGGTMPRPEWLKKVRAFWN